MQLRRHQRAAADKVKKRFAEGTNRLVVQLPTGTGKTPLFAALPDEFNFAPDDWMLVLAHREELVEQAADKLQEWNPSHKVGIEMGNRTTSNEQLIVASPQTLGRKGSDRIERFRNRKSPRVIVTDECHHATADSYKRIYDFFNVWNNTDILSLGVTATPNRADGKGLGEVYQEIVYRMSMLDAIRQGWITDLRGVSVRTSVDLGDVHTTAGDYNRGELASKTNIDARNDLVVRAWLKHGEDRQTVVFAVDIEHAKAIAAKFKEYGVAAEAVWGDDPDRADKLKYHKAGHLKVLVNCEVLTEGYDDKRVSCIVLARPTQSESLYTQMIGRGTRLEEGIANWVDAKSAGQPLTKNDCLIIDTVDNTGRHSLITLPSLFGLNPKMDMKRKKITEVMDEVEDIKLKHPAVDLSGAEDVIKLRSYAEEVDLFKVTFPPEIVQLSEFQWRKVGTDSYILMLVGGENIVLLEDILGHWKIIGKVNGYTVEGYKPTLEEAIQESDYWVRIHGGRSLCSLVKRKSKWHDEEPTAQQLKMCRYYNINVPPGATKGQVHLKLNEVLSEVMKKKKKAS